MSDSRARFGADDSCELTSEPDDPGTSWPNVRSWADDWLAEKRSEWHGDTSGVLVDACDNAVPGVADALVVLAQAAANDQDLLGWSSSERVRCPESAPVSAFPAIAAVLQSRR